jgi:hypothetical protein
LKDASAIVVAEPILQLQRQLEQFRSTHRHRARIPEALWDLAVGLAREHGLYAVAHPLRLDYAQLKRRLAGAPTVTGKKRAAPPRFVELIAAHSAAECVIEFESGRGGKMRIQWKGSGAPDWGSLLHAWREAER